jgi:hypothetical protein
MSQTLAPPAPPKRPDIRTAGPGPSTTGYWVGAIVGIVGLALVGALAVMTVARMNDHIDAFARTPIPGTATVILDASIGRTIYVEGVAPVALPALDLRVTDPNGNDVTVRPYDLSLRYDVPGSPGTVGYAVGTFRTTASGPYTIESAGTAPPGTFLAIGDSFATSIVGYAIGAFLLLLLTLVGASALVITTAVRRSRARRPV